MTARLEAAAAAVDAAAEVTTTAAEHLARAAAEDGRISVAKLDRHQVLAYDLAHAASALEGCRVMLDYGGRGGGMRGSRFGLELGEHRLGLGRSSGGFQPPR